MPSRLFATTALALSLTATAAPSSVMPRPDEHPVESADGIIAHSARPGAADCPTVARTEREQRADRLATLMIRHSMVSRLALGRDITESAGEAVRSRSAQRHDDAPRSCS